MLEDTLKEIRERGYKALWSYSTEDDKFYVRVRKDQRFQAMTVGMGPNIDFVIDVAIRTLVERMEKENEDHRTELESGA